MILWLRSIHQRFARWCVIPICMDLELEEEECMEPVPFRPVFQVRRSPLPIARVVKTRGFSVHFHHREFRDIVSLRTAPECPATTVSQETAP